MEERYLSTREFARVLGVSRDGGGLGEAYWDCYERGILSPNRLWVLISWMLVYLVYVWVIYFLERLFKVLRRAVVLDCYANKPLEGPLGRL
jgi:hypothetical protein